MLEGRHYQNAYVVPDVDDAVAAFRRAGRIEREMVFDATVEADTPAGRVEMRNRLAFLWIGGLQYELIQPVSGDGGLYSSALSAVGAPRFHHSCTRVADWANFRARVARQSLPVVLEGGGEALRFLYLDARSLVGHHLEYCWMTDERWTQMGGPADGRDLPAGD